MNDKFKTLIISIIILVCTIGLSAQSTRKPMYMNFQKLVLYYSSGTGEYYLAVVATDNAYRGCGLDIFNTNVILETMEGRKKTIDSEDLKISCLGSMYNKVIGKKNTLFRFNFVIDNSGSIDPPSLKFVQDTLTKFINHVPLVFEAQVIRFSDKIHVKEPFTKDKKSLINDITRQVPTGGTALFDAIETGVQELVALGDDVPLRFSIILTDGKNNSSKRNPDPNTFKTKIISKCKDNLIPLFIVGVTDNVDRQTLEAISKFGMYIHKSSFPDIDEAFKVILDQIKNTYIFKIPAIGKFSDLKTIYITRKTAAGNVDTIQDIIVH